MAAKKKAKPAARGNARAAKPKYSAKAYLSAPRQPLKKSDSLYYPKPGEMKGVRVEPPKIPQHAEPLDITPTRGMRIEGKKKSLPYAVTSIGGAAVLSGALAFFFYCVIGLDIVFSLMLALPFFIGLSILFFNFLELSERTGAQ
ncbi:MAG: hypothetical protein NTX79_03330 [Candidatus Micrarchaeota archaeon]|nr:hypothetical protein [Candidatus Micrarchaeota archaeon]